MDGGVCFLLWGEPGVGSPGVLVFFCGLYSRDGFSGRLKVVPCYQTEFFAGRVVGLIYRAAVLFMKRRLGGWENAGAKAHP